MVATKITNNRFTIKTDKPAVEVSWQVTGIRKDAWANDHRIKVEEQKSANEVGLYRWLLERNARMFAVSFAIDNVGDVYLTGRLPLSSVTPEDLDRVIGSVLTYSDEGFDRALELGFKSSIQKEWDWRVKRGESLRNLEAFAHFADPANR